ncbi:hypothetical protein [Haloactinomyces albus]|uniref:Uncharacterized protein n=1 Tax=Haloactinomyces albus TaxID=1352928 RepID=A0AAE4CMY8_9ACTN|nr:hypothetical protein [Haloactinomyces albus]MDR7301422.1 hypothetical protein [Haloactinomyces albus]
MKEIKTGQELLGVVELKNIQFYEVQARLYNGFDGDSPAASAADGSDQEDTSEQEWQFRIQVDSRNVNLRARLVVHGPDAGYVVDGAAFYVTDEEVNVEQDALEEFLNRAAMLALYPFIRESLHEAARKINANPPLLGMFSPDSIQIHLDRPEDERGSVRAEE